MTTAGYPLTARVWERGTPFESATEIVRVAPDDMAVVAQTLHTGRGAEPTLARFPTIFTSELHLLREGELVSLDVPDDAQTSFVGDQIVLQLVSDWTVGERSYAAGSVVSADLQGVLAGAPEVEILVEPGPRSTVAGVSTTRDLGPWARSRYERWMTSPEDNRFFFEFSSFTRPTTLYWVGEDGSTREVASLSSRYDASDVVVEQFQANVRGRHPVALLRGPARGRPHGREQPHHPVRLRGVQQSMTPRYLGARGKNWVAAGGVYVLANIRGGGEFGPSWWRAALKETRQRAYDDGAGTFVWPIRNPQATLAQPSPSQGEPPP